MGIRHRVDSIKDGRQRRRREDAAQAMFTLIAAQNLGEDIPAEELDKAVAEVLAVVREGASPAPSEGGEDGSAPKKKPKRGAKA